MTADIAHVVVNVRTADRYVRCLMGEIQFSAADIRVFLAEHLPYYEAEDKDDFLYIAKPSDIERVALELYRHLTSRSSRAANAGACWVENALCGIVAQMKADREKPPPA